MINKKVKVFLSSELMEFDKCNTTIQLFDMQSFWTPESEYQTLNTQTEFIDVCPSMTSAVAQTPFFKVKGELVVRLDDLLNNTEEILRLAYQQRSSISSQVSHQSSSSSQEQRFQWTPLPSRIFAAIVTALGVTRVKPRQIEKYFPADYGLSTAALGSHLQKYKLRVARENKLEVNQIRDFQAVAEYDLNHIACLWCNHSFTGFSESQLRQLVISLQ